MEANRSNSFFWQIVFCRSTCTKQFHNEWLLWNTIQLLFPKEASNWIKEQKSIATDKKKFPETAAAKPLVKNIHVPSAANEWVAWHSLSLLLWWRWWSDTCEWLSQAYDCTDCFVVVEISLQSQRYVNSIQQAHHTGIVRRTLWPIPWSQLPTSNSNRLDSARPISRNGSFQWASKLLWSLETAARLLYTTSWAHQL